MSIEIEIRVIASLIFIGNPDNNTAQESILNLDPMYFKDEEAKELFSIIYKQFYAKKPFDVDSLFSLIPSSLHMFLCDAAARSWSTNLLAADTRFLKESHNRSLINSRLIKLVNEFSAEKSPDLACDIALTGSIEISKLGIVNENHVFTAEMNTENFLSKTVEPTPTYASGIEIIDKLNGGGFKNKSLITIAGRSGMGKTCFGVHLAHYIAANNPIKHVLFYSAEMAASDIYEKQLSSILGKQIAEASEGEKLNAVSKSIEVPFTIHSRPLPPIDYIETSARITAVKTPFSVIVVDYIGIVQNKSNFESHALVQADIALRLAGLAIELNCIVIALTQVNRDHAKREDKCPVTTDAADSSGTERSSSYWFGIYRPVKDDETACENDVVIKCRKNRFGDTWKAYFAFNKGTFGEVDQYLYTAKPMSPQKGIHNYVGKNGADK
jgi:replicative DNA helicase